MKHVIQGELVIQVLLHCLIDRVLCLLIEFNVRFDFEIQLINLLLKLSLLILQARNAKSQPAQHPLQQINLLFVRNVLELRIIQSLIHSLNALVHF